MDSQKISRLLLKKIASSRKRITQDELLKLMPGTNIRYKSGKRKKTRKRTGSQGETQENKLQSMLNSLVALRVLAPVDSKFEVLSQGQVNGIFQAVRSGDGYIKGDFSSEEVFVARENKSGAMTGDRVVASLFLYTKGMWHGGVTKILEVERRKIFAIYRGKRLDTGYRRKSELQHAQVLDQNGLELVLLEEAEVRSAGLNADEPLILELVRQSNNIPQKGQFDLLKGRIIEVLDPRDKDLDFKRVSLRHNLPLKWDNKEDFGLGARLNVSTEDELSDPKEIIKKLDQSSGMGKLKRRDLTSLFTITIDGADAKDFDDAISYEIVKGEHHLYVHIADVSAFVQLGSALDQEALKRGNSTYLLHNVIHMLPPLLSEKFCSLQKDSIRATLTCLLKYDKNINLKSYEFFSAYISVNHRLTYDLVEEILQKRKISPDQLDKYGIGKKELNNLAKFLPMLEKHTLELKKQRDAHGRLSLYIPELKIKESAKEGKSSLERFSFELEKRSNSMVEESMLSANQAACQFIKKKGEITLFRVHEKPDAENIYKLMTSLHFFGIEADISLERPELEIGNIIRKIKGHPLEGYFNIMILRSLKQAKYFHDPDIGHFGLGFRDYLHFTSPIRRYPDLVVHRQLKNFLAGGQPPYGREQIEQMAMQTSATERKSTDAERDIRQLFLCRLFREYEGREFAAYLSGAGRNAFYLTLREFPIEGRLLFQNIYGDYFDYFENEHTAIGRDTHRRFTLGDEIKVVLRKADWEERVLEFELDLV